MFPKVRQLLNQQQIEELGNELQKGKSSSLSSPILNQPGPLTNSASAQ